MNYDYISLQTSFLRLLETSWIGWQVSLVTGPTYRSGLFVSTFLTRQAGNKMDGNEAPPKFSRTTTKKFL